MKKIIMALVAASLFASVPAMAAEHGKQHDPGCQKECEMLVRNCSQEVDTLQQKIGKLENAINNNAARYSQAELKQLKDNLQDAKKELSDIELGGA